MNKVLIIGDCHADPQNLINVQIEYKNLTKDDYVIVCGDFGFIWKIKPDYFENYWLDEINNYPFTTLFVSG